MNREAETQLPATIIVLSVDRLRSSMLGPYGNTSIETPGFDRLASRSVLFDQVIARHTGLQMALSDCWNFSANNDTDDSVENKLPDAVADAGGQTLLITDDPSVASLPIADSFDEVVELPQPASQHSASTLAETAMASFFAQALEAIGDLEPGTLAWLHCRGMSGPWDAPVDFRQRQAGPDDPDPPTFVKPPSSYFDREQSDPDELLGLEQAYAAQVMLLDEFVGVLQDQLEEIPALQSAWFCLLSPRGYPLGEHGLIGDGDEDRTSVAQQMAELHFENVHVPLTICPPMGLGDDSLRGHRCGQLTQVDWLHRWLRATIGGDHHAMQMLTDTLAAAPVGQPETALTQTESATALQTHHWKLIRSSSESRLYAKPDDRWEVNDVASRCPQVVKDLQQMS